VVVHGIGLLHPFYGGEGVYMARAMLNLTVIDRIPALRKASHHEQKPEIIPSGKFYPNPASSEVTYVSNKEFEKGDNLEIFDNVGSLIKIISLPEKQNKFTFNVANLQSGVYYSKVISASKEKRVEKLVIIK
jgi:hypothetical protein